MSEHLRKNPFLILELDVTAPAIEVERQGQKLLGMLALELSGADRYFTPFGACERTEDDVRTAMAELRDPNRRLVWEIWARGKDASVVRSETTAHEDTSLFALFGFPR